MSAFLMFLPLFWIKLTIMATREPASREGKSPNSRTVAGTVNTSSINAFLKSYKPEEEGFTTAREMMRIRDGLNLDNLNINGLRKMRDRVVRFYSNLLDKETRYNADGTYAGRTERFYGYNEAMMSVTAVIDDRIFRRGGRV